MIQPIVERILTNVQKVIVGKEEVIQLLLVAVLCEGHVLLEDVPGTGKTTLARALSAGSRPAGRSAGAGQPLHGERLPAPGRDARG